MQNPSLLDPVKMLLPKPRGKMTLRKNSEVRKRELKAAIVNDSFTSFPYDSCNLSFLPFK